MFSKDAFVEECQNAVRHEKTPQAAIREILTRAVSEPGAVLRDLGELESGGIQTLHHDHDLTIINVVWSRYMTVMPHNHEMWANIGVYTGREDNIFWRRIADAGNGKIEAAGAKSLAGKDVATLGKDIIHSVTNPLGKFTGAIHVYGGDFFGVERSEWDPETHFEQAYNMDKNIRMFDTAEAG